jgi:hypothetical protein
VETGLSSNNSLCSVALRTLFITRLKANPANNTPLARLPPDTHLFVDDIRRWTEIATVQRYRSMIFLRIISEYVQTLTAEGTP